MTMASLFIALGVALPVGFHAIGAGKVFLPMHIPVLLGGFFLGPLAGSLVGAATPLLSGFLTGMPLFSPPIAQAMVFELSIYGFVVGFMQKSMKCGPYLSIVGGMLVGRLVYGATGYLLLPFFGFPQVPFWAPLSTSLIASLPGVLLQVILLPPLARFLEGKNTDG